MVPFPINGIIYGISSPKKTGFQNSYLRPPEFVSEGPYHNSK